MYPQLMLLVLAAVLLFVSAWLNPAKEQKMALAGLALFALSFLFTK